MYTQHYKMIEGNYTISGRIFEAQDLIPKQKGFLGLFISDMCDPFVIVECGGKHFQTSVKKKNNSPV